MTAVVRGSRYDREKEPLLKDVSCNLSGSSRVAVMGSNGCGKSTLLKLAAGREEAWEGEVIQGAGLRIGCVRRPEIKYENERSWYKVYGEFGFWSLISQQMCYRAS